MCYYVKSKAKIKELRERFGVEFDGQIEQLPEHENISGFAHPKLPVISCEDPGKIHLMEWGLIPHWVKDEHTAMEMRNLTLNARSETLFEKPSFRSILTRRCLILVNGFYEWQTQAAKKAKKAFYIHLKSNDLFAMGGLYDEWVNTSTGELCRGFSIITVEANPLMALIHNTKKRMPLILPANTEKNWLQTGMSEKEIKSFITQYPEQDMVAEELSGQKNNHPEETGRLF
jgi:putative SOS response-associated peptidase YedK